MILPELRVNKEPQCDVQNLLKIGRLSDTKWWRMFIEACPASGRWFHRRHTINSQQVANSFPTTDIVRNLLRTLPRLCQLDLQFDLFAVATDRDRHLFARLIRSERQIEVIQIRDPVLAKLDDVIAAFQTTLRSGTAR